MFALSRVTIDTLEELLASNLQYGGWGEVNQKFFQTSPDSLNQKIGSRFQVVNSSEEALKLVAEGKFAFYENIYFLKVASVLRRKNSSMTMKDMLNERNLHIMKDCVINMPISIGRDLLIVFTTHTHTHTHLVPKNLKTQYSLYFL